MELIQTKKYINMAEVEICAEFAANAASGNPELNWNKLLEKINRDRSSAGVPTLRQRCFIAIMKSGGASDGRIKGWSKRRYLKSIGYKQQNYDFQKSLQDGIKKFFPTQQVEVPQDKTPVVENVDVESSAEAEEATKLSDGALALLKYFVHHGVTTSNARKFYGIGTPHICELIDELLNIGVIRVCNGIAHKKGCRYELTLDKETIFGLYPDVKSCCIANDMPKIRKCKKSSVKVEEQKVVEKDTFNPADRLQDAICLIRTNCEKGIAYNNEDDLMPLDPNWTHRKKIHTLLIEQEILIPVGVNGSQYYFDDPEDHISIHDNPKIDNMQHAEVIQEKNEIVPCASTKLPPKHPKVSHLTEDDAEHVVVNNYRSDVSYRITRTVQGFVIDIM